MSRHLPELINIYNKPVLPNFAVEIATLDYIMKVLNFLKRLLKYNTNIGRSEITVVTQGNLEQLFILHDI